MYLFLTEDFFFFVMFGYKHILYLISIIGILVSLNTKPYLLVSRKSDDTSMQEIIV